MRDGATGTVKAVRLVHRQQCFGAFERDALLAQRVCSGAQAPQPPAGDCTGRTQAFRPFHDQECRPLEEGGRIPIRSHTGVIGWMLRGVQKALVILLENASLSAGLDSCMTSVIARKRAPSAS